MDNFVKKLFYGSIIFICLYRVAFFNPDFVPGLFIGLIGILFLFRKQIFTRIISHKNVKLFLLVASIIFTYTLIIDIAYIQNLEILSLRNLFSVRFLMFIILTVSCSYIVELIVANGDMGKLNSALQYAVGIQFAFFVIMFVNPDTKFVLYGIFGMQDSINLYDHNIATRGFGVGSELNYTAPVATAIMALLIFNNKFIKSVIFVSQIANATIVMASVVFFIQRKKSLIYFFVLFPFLFWLLFSKYDAIGISNLLPRLDREISSNFTITINSLLNDHVLYSGQSLWDFIFGSGVNLIPTAGVNTISSDIGWIIMLNYGGALFIFLYLLFIFSILQIAPFTNLVKILLFAVMIAMNSKGLFFGPNALLYFVFLVIFNSIKSREFDTGSIKSIVSPDVAPLQAKPLARL